MTAWLTVDSSPPSSAEVFKLFDAFPLGGRRVLPAFTLEMRRRARCELADRLV